MEDVVQQEQWRNQLASTLDLDDFLSFILVEFNSFHNKRRFIDSFKWMDQSSCKYKMKESSPWFDTTLHYIRLLYV